MFSHNKTRKELLYNFKTVYFVLYLPYKKFGKQMNEITDTTTATHSHFTLYRRIYMSHMLSCTKQQDGHYHMTFVVRFIEFYNLFTQWDNRTLKVCIRLHCKCHIAVNNHVHVRVKLDIHSSPWSDTDIQTNHSLFRERTHQNDSSMYYLERRQQVIIKLKLE